MPVKTDSHRDWKRTKRKVKRYPKTLLTFVNKDKRTHERWTRDRDLGNIPHPARIILAGPPGSGKSTAIKNLLLRADPPYKKILIICTDPNFTQEYADVDHIALNECPHPKDFPGREKWAVILEDLDFTAMTRTQKYNLNRLFGYVSSHKNITIMLSVQDPIACPTFARRAANFFIFAKSPDVNATAAIASRVGMNKTLLLKLFGLCPQPYDTIWIDGTFNTPAPLRKNCYTIIARPDSKQQTNKNAETPYSTPPSYRVQFEQNAGNESIQTSNEKANF